MNLVNLFDLYMVFFFSFVKRIFVHFLSIRHSEKWMLYACTFRLRACECVENWHCQCLTLFEHGSLMNLFLLVGNSSFFFLSADAIRQNVTVVQFKNWPFSRVQWRSGMHKMYTFCQQYIAASRVLRIQLFFVRNLSIIQMASTEFSTDIFAVSSASFLLCWLLLFCCCFDLK